MSSAKKKTAASRAKVQAKAAPKAQPKVQAKVKPAVSSNAAWAQSSAKLYPFAQFNGSQAEEASAAAAKQMQSAAEQMMKYSSDIMQQMFSAANTAGASASQAKGADQFARSATAATKSMNDVVELGRENAEAWVECGNIAASVTKQMSAELANYINKAFAQNAELSKMALSCRTLNDMFDLQNRFVKSNLDAFFNESVKLSEMAFQCATDVSEPLNERVSATTERLSKAFSA